MGLSNWMDIYEQLQHYFTFTLRFWNSIDILFVRSGIFFDWRLGSKKN